MFGDCMASGVFGGMGYPGYLSMAYISSHVRCAVYKTKNSCITQAEKLLCKFVYSAIMALGLGSCGVFRNRERPSPYCRRLLGHYLLLLN